MESIQDKADAVAVLMKERLGIRGKTLAVKLRGAGRLLPKKIKRDVAVLAEAAHHAQSPKLYKMIDHGRVDLAYDNSLKHLKDVDVAYRRRGKLLSVLGSLAFSFLVVGAVLIAILRWRGFI